jgi:hypothetical protein
LNNFICYRKVSCTFELSRNLGMDKTEFRTDTIKKMNLFLNLRILNKELKNLN